MSLNPPQLQHTHVQQRLVASGAKLQTRAIPQPSRRLQGLQCIYLTFKTEICDPDSLAPLFVGQCARELAINPSHPYFLRRAEAFPIEKLRTAPFLAMRETVLSNALWKHFGTVTGLGWWHVAAVPHPVACVGELNAVWRRQKIL